MTRVAHVLVSVTRHPFERTYAPILLE